MGISNEQLAHELTMQYMKAVCAKPAMKSDEYVKSYFEKYSEILKAIQRHRGQQEASDFGAQF